jgi:hypothetical protein
MTQNNKFEGWTYVLALNYKGEAKYGYYIHNFNVIKGDINGDAAFYIDDMGNLAVLSISTTGCIMHTTDIYSMFPLAQEQVDRVLDSYNYEFKDGEIKKQFKLPDYFSYADKDKTIRYYIEVLDRTGDVVECIKYSCNHIKSEVNIERDWISELALTNAYLNNDGEEWDGEEESLIDYYVRG